MAELAIEAEGLGKAYRRFASPGARLVEALSLGRVQRHEPFWAVRGVDIRVPEDKVQEVLNRG